MIYSFVFILVGIILMFLIIKFKKTDKNIFDNTKSLEGMFAVLLLIALGIVTLFIGWK
jgi:hypothetical protein